MKYEVSNLCAGRWIRLAQKRPKNDREYGVVCASKPCRWHDVHWIGIGIGIGIGMLMLKSI